MPSASQKGQYWQHRTIVWLKRHGFAVAIAQRMLSVWTPTGMVHTKRDQLGADVIAMSHEKTLAVQIKGGETRRQQLSAARKEFAKYPLGPHCEQWCVLWAPRAREPEIVVVAVGPQPAQHPVIVPARKKAKRTSLPLFSRTA